MNPQPRFRIAVIALLNVCLTLVARAQTSISSGNSVARGRVCDSQHHPVAGATVVLRSATVKQFWKTQTDSAGTFAFSAVPDGDYTIIVEAEKLRTSAAVTLTANETKTVELTLSDSEVAFFDQPTFSVAGVTDTSNLGGHGSDAVVRTKNALAKATASLSRNAANDASTSNATEDGLREEQRRNPSGFASNYRLGEFLASRGRNADAKPFLARASELELKDKSLNVQNRADLHHLLGDVSEMTGDPLTAVREYQRAAELDPTETNIFDWGAELLLHHAPEPATEVFSNGLRRYPQSARMLIGLGVVWYVRGSYEQASQWLCDAADLDPDNPTPYLFLGRILAAESSVSPVVAERLARFTARQPQNAMANYDLAVGLWKQRKAEDRDTVGRVQALLEKAVALDPTLSEAFLQLGIVHFERKDFPQAIAAYQQAIQLSPLMEQAHYRLAQAYRLSGQSDKAQNELKTYEEISREKANELDRERSDIKQFVYTLRGENRSPVRP